jgi:hypothetical protein
VSRIWAAEASQMAMAASKKAFFWGEKVDGSAVDTSTPALDEVSSAAGLSSPHLVSPPRATNAAAVSRPARRPLTRR